MPLIEVRQVTPRARIGLWHMAESVDALCAQLPCYRDEVIERYKSESRRKEFLSIRMMLHLMTEDASLRIHHKPSGKPILAGWNISISHTRDYAALMLSKDECVALDIEYRSERVKRISSRFIRSDEQADSVEQMLTIWSAKETLYKLFSEDELEFSEMRITNVGEKLLLGENLKRDQSVNIGYELTDAYVLTWSCQ